MYRNGIKRILDFCLALVALICLSPLLLAVTIWLHFANKGAGAFFLQERPGLHERIFKVIKFKSMTDERDANGNFLPDEKRLTKVGKFVRSTSIDELPQLWNVLRGDMSFIGPRPLLSDYLPWYTEQEHLRHSVRPGISGWAQVNGRNNLSWDEKLSLDVYYVKHLTFGLDFKIFLKTIINVIQHKDINVIPGIRLGRLDDIRRNQRNEN